MKRYEVEVVWAEVRHYRSTVIVEADQSYVAESVATDRLRADRPQATAINAKATQLRGAQPPAATPLPLNARTAVRLVANDDGTVSAVEAGEAGSDG